jgi:hypothetical protein
MFRRIAAVTAALMLLTALPAAGEGPGAGAGAEQWADANWIVGAGPSPTYYFALGMRFVDDGGLHTMGVVGKGSCFTEGNRRFRMISCMASGVAHEVELTDFGFDPALGSARLHLVTGSQEHDITWKGRGDTPYASVGVGFSSCGVDTSNGAARLASAGGTVLGKEMSPKGARMNFHFLMEGVGASVYTDCQRNDDGSITVRRTIKFRVD